MRSTSACNFEIIALTETWLNDNFFNSEIFNSQYTVFRRDRNYNELGSQRGGGVLIAALGHLISSGISTSHSNFYEDVWIQLDCDGSKIIVGCVYISPNSTVECYQSFCDTCESLKNTYSNYRFLIYGDFNLPSINWVFEDDTLVPRELPSGSAEVLVDTMYFLELQQMNIIRNYLGRTLDLIFVDDFIDFSITPSADPLVAMDAYHPAIETCFSLGHIKTLRDRTEVKVFDFHRCNYSKLNHFYEQANWSFLSTTTDIDSMITLFYETLFQGINHSVPKKTIKGDKYPKWYDKGLRKCISQKNRLYKKYKKSGQRGDYEAYNRIRLETKVRIDMCFLLYVTSTEHLIPQNVKHFWSFINNLKRNSNLPMQMKYKGRTLEGSDCIADAFAMHFQASYSNHDNLDMTSIESVQFATTLSFHNFQPQEIADKLNVLDISKKAGPDGIPAIFLKSCSSSLALPLCIVFQRSLDCGLFPKRWKFSLLLPIFKSGDRCNVENYRGISILSAIPKVFESILTDEIFLTYRFYIIPEQHGFFSKRSTTTNLAVYQNFLITSAEVGHQVDSIYTDLAKAFDSVCHTLLLKKLSDIGISGKYLAWIRSYLEDRTQRVEVCGYSSKDVKVTSGVPQGSHLGPVLFLLFINDVSYCFHSSHFLLYADDLKFYNVRNSANPLQPDLDRFASWCSSNLLEINISKCKSITFHKSTSPHLPTYMIGGQQIDNVEFITDLGVTFDQKLTFRMHIDNIVVKSCRLLGFIKRNTKYINDTKALTCLYNSLVRSTLEYCSVIWTPNYNIHINRLENVQNKFLKYLLYKHHFPTLGTPYETRLLLCGMRSLEQRRKQALLIFLYKILNNEIDCSTLLESILLLVPIRRTRQQQLFYEHPHRTNYGFTAFADRMIHNYNRNYRECDLFNCSLMSIKRCV